MNGYLMVYPLETNITWHSGFDAMTTYKFGKEKIAHSFCPTCGTSIGGKSTDPTFYSENRAVNVSQPQQITAFRAPSSSCDNHSPTIFQVFCSALANQKS